jgi:hypothetical protein
LENQSAETDRLLFSQLVITFYNSAWQSLGKIMDPSTGQVERDLAIARNSIDILDMLKRRTAGNLEQEESDFLEQALYQLRMNYLEELEADKKEKSETETASSYQDAAAAGDTGETEETPEQTEEAGEKPAAEAPKAKSRPKKPKSSAKTTKKKS